MKKTKRALRLGIFVASALLLFIVAIYLIGSKQNLFTSNTDIHASFRDIRGLMPGNQVRFAGINIGTVKDISLVADSSVVVTLSVRDKYTDYIYKNSQVQIGQEGLMGGKIVLITTGDPSSGKVESGDYLPIADGLDIQAMIAQASEMFDEARSTVVSLRSIAEKMDKGDGDIARLLNDRSLTNGIETATNRLNTSLADINSITNKINNGEGDLGKLIKEDAITADVGQIMATLNVTSKKADSLINELHQTSQSFNHGEGVLPRLLHDKEMGLHVDTTISNVDEGVIQLTRAAETIADSWIFRLFSKRNKKKKERVKEVRVQPGDTLIIQQEQLEAPTSDNQ